MAQMTALRRWSIDDMTVGDLSPVTQQSIDLSPALRPPRKEGRIGLRKAAINCVRPVDRRHEGIDIGGCPRAVIHMIADRPAAGRCRHRHDRAIGSDTTDDDGRGVP